MPITYMGTSLTRERTPLGPYRRPMPGVAGGQGGGCFLMGEVPLYTPKHPAGAGCEARWGSDGNPRQLKQVDARPIHSVQGYLAHKAPPPLRTLQLPHASGATL